MMMSGPALVAMAEAIRGFRSFMLIKSTVTSTPATFPNSAASRLNSTSEAGTKLTHSRMLSFVPFGKLGAFCAATIAGIPPTAAAPVAAPATLRNARRSNLVTPPGCVAMAHPRRTGPFTTSGPAGDRPAALHILARAPRNGGDHSTTHRSCQALFPHRSRASEARRHSALATMPSIVGRASGSSDDGAPGRSRTCDPRIRSPMLYPTELQAHQEVTIHHLCATPRPPRGAHSAFGALTRLPGIRMIPHCLDLSEAKGRRVDSPDRRGERSDRDGDLHHADQAH